MLDGYLKIKTKLDNSDVDKGITELENKIKKLETDNSDLSTEQNGLQQELNKYEKLQQEADSYKQKIKELNTQKEDMFKSNPSLAVSKDTSEYANIKEQITQMQQKYMQANNEIDKQAPKIEIVRSKLDKIKTKQTENNAKIQQFKQKIEQINLNKVQKGIDNVGKNIQKSIGKLGKMSMAVVGIRTAFSAVRQAINAVAQYNPQIAANFEYMRYCIANLLAPAVQWIVKLLYTALSYINAIANAWFGINIFGNASVKNFQKMQKSAGGTAKSAKEIQKSLQGFDEMNILQDSNSSSGGSGVSTPNIDLSNMQGEIPQWLEWIIDNKDLILATISGIVAGLLGFKMLNLAASLGFIENHLLGIKSIGIGVMVAGIILLIQSVIKYLNDPSWENFGKIIISIGVALLGLALIIGSVPLAIGAAIAIIIGLIVSNWENIKQFLQNGIDWLNSKVDWIRENFGILGEGIYKIFTAILQELLNIFDDVFKGIKEILDGIFKVFKGIFTGDIKTVLEGFKQIFIGIFDSLWGIVKGILNLIIRGINTLIRGANKIHFDIPDWVPGFGGKKFGFNIQQIPLLAKGGVVSQPTQAIIGEAGKEAVVPLENNLEWLDILATKIANKIDASGGSFIINMDSRTIQRGIAKRQQELAFAKNGR